MAVRTYSLATDGNNFLGNEGLFRVRDFKCKDGTDYIKLDDNLPIILERIYYGFEEMRKNQATTTDWAAWAGDGYGIQMEIVSGYRTPSHSIAQGGYSTDPHTRGIAADIAVRIVPSGDAGVGQASTLTESNIQFRFTSLEICALAQQLGHKQGIGIIEDWGDYSGDCPTNVHIDVRSEWCWFDETNGEATVYDWMSFLQSGQSTEHETQFYDRVGNISLNTLSMGKNATNITINQPTSSSQKVRKVVTVTPSSESKHFGIDISGWNKPFDLAKAKKAGMEFVIMKIANITRSGDLDFESLWSDGTIEQCVRNEIPFGIYLYDYADKYTDMESVMNKVKTQILDVINQKKVTITSGENTLVVEARDWMAFPVYLDIEEPCILGEDASTVQAHVGKFLNCVYNRYDADPSQNTKAVPYVFGTYCSTSWYLDKLFPSSGSPYRTLNTWCADWGSTMPEFSTAQVDGNTSMVWQYSSNSGFSGFPFDVDRNYAYCDIKFFEDGQPLATKSTEVIKKKTSTKSKKQIYEEMQRADYNKDGGVTIEDAQLILRKSAKLLPTSESIFGIYNDIAEKGIIIPNLTDEVLENITSLDRNFEFLISEKLLSLYSVNQQQDMIDGLRSLVDTAVAAAQSKATNATLQMQNELEAAIIDMIIGEKPFDSRFKIFKNANNILNGYLVLSYSQGVSDFTKESFYSWQEKKLKSRLFETWGIRELRQLIKGKINANISAEDYADIWQSYIQKVKAKYDSIGIHYEITDNILNAYSVGNDILDYFGGVDGQRFMNIYNVLDIINSIFNICPLSKEQVTNLCYEENKVFSLQDAYIAFLTNLVLQSGLWGATLRGDAEKLDKEITVDIGFFESKALEAVGNPSQTWYYPTSDDVYENEEGFSPYIAFRDIVRAIVSCAREQEQAQKIYRDFFKEEYNLARYWGEAQNANGNTLHYLQNSTVESGYDFFFVNGDAQGYLKADCIKEENGNQITFTIKPYYEFNGYGKIAFSEAEDDCIEVPTEPVYLYWAEFQLKTNQGTGLYNLLNQTSPNFNFVYLPPNTDTNKGLYDLYQICLPNGDKQICLQQFSSASQNYRRIYYTYEYLRPILQAYLALEKISTGFKNEITRISHLIKKTNNTIEQPDFVFGTEEELAKYYFLLAKLGKKGDWPGADKIKKTTWFGSEFSDEKQAFQHYDFYKRIKTIPTSLGKFYPLSDKSENAQIFYFKNGDAYYPLNKIDNPADTKTYVDIGNNVILDSDHTLADIMHENHIYLDKVNNWKLWSHLENKEAVKDLATYNSLDPRIAEEWRQNKRPFVRSNSSGLGFGNGGNEYDANQALMVARYMTILYPGLLAYRDENFNVQTGWKKGLSMNPESLVFWIDFLDDQGDISRYSVKNIGQRQKVVNQDKVRAIKYIDTEKIVFISPTEEDLFKDGSTKQTFAATHSGYKYVQLGSGAYNSMSLSSQGIDAYTVIENMLYNYAQCAESVSLSCIPLYFLEPNTRIQIYNPDTDINGIYNLSKITIPLGHAGTMSLNLTKALEDVVTREEIVSV